MSNGSVRNVPCGTKLKLSPEFDCGAFAQMRRGGMDDVRIKKSCFK